MASILDMLFGPGAIGAPQQPQAQEPGIQPDPMAPSPIPPQREVDDTMLRAEIARRMRERLEAQQGEITTAERMRKPQGAPLPETQVAPRAPAGVPYSAPEPEPQRPGFSYREPDVQPQQPPMAAPPRQVPSQATQRPAAPQEPQASPFDVPMQTRFKDALTALSGRAPPDRTQLALQQNATYRALLAKGIDPQLAQGMVVNPQIMAQMAPQIFGTKKVEPTTLNIDGEQVSAMPMPQIGGYMLPNGTIFGGQYHGQDARSLGLLGGGKPQQPQGDGQQPLPVETQGAPLGTNANAPSGTPFGTPRDTSPVYQAVPPPPGVNPKEWKAKEAARISGEIAHDAEKAQGAVDYIKQAAHVRDLIGRTIPGSDEGRKYGDVIGPWAGTNANAGNKSVFEKAADANNMAGSVAALIDPQAWITGARKVVGSIPIVGSEVAAGNAARTEVNKALTSLQQAELMSIYGKRPPVAGIEQQKQANPTIEVQDKDAVLRMLDERERNAFDKIAQAIKIKALNPSQLDPAIVKRGVDLGVLRAEDFPQYRSGK